MSDPGEANGTDDAQAAGRSGSVGLVAGGGRRRRSVVVGMQAMTENLREKQARARDTREARKVMIEPTHRHIMQLVADHLNIDTSSVEEFILDSSQGMKMFNNFLVKDGSRGLKFYYQESEVPGSEDTGRSIPGHSKGSTMTRLFITDGKTEPFQGICVYFLRPNNSLDVNVRNIAELIVMGTLEAESAENALEHLHQTVTNVYKPALKGYTDWGDLDNTPQGKKTFSGFLDICDNFVQSLSSAQKSAVGVVKLAGCKNVDLFSLNTAQDCITASTNVETVSVLEELVVTWCKQIEQVLTESEQMRKEADDTGPLAELEHWRQLNARFSAIMEQIKSNNCKMVISTLHVAKSKVLKMWREQDNKITDAANEAKDNMKYLYTLEKFCDPLYRCDLVTMSEAIPSLINAIRMIHSISRYYNTSERMTSLFIKVTNQMVKACKSYITDDGMTRIWDQPPDELITKIHHCIELYQQYQGAFQRTKKKIEETVGEKPFDFSEMYIFGKYDAFCKRLAKIECLVNTIEAYSILQDCRIEGIENMVAKFLHIYSSVKKKPYDILDHRKLDFDHDFDDFKRHIHDLEGHLQAFMDSCFEKFPSTIQSLKLLVRFENLGIPSLGIKEKYRMLFSHFGHEIEVIKRLYQKCKDDPPLPRDMPPVAGKIAWARQLSRKIQEPMDIFRNQPEVLKGSDAKKVIRNYNRVGQVLLEFEILYHRAWIKSVDACKEALQVPLLVRHPETRELLMNLDPMVHQVIREAECMRKLDLEIPESANVLIYTQKTLKSNYDQLKLLLEENSTIRLKIPSIFVPLMGPSLKQVDDSLRPGLTSLTWTSLNLGTYFNSIKQALKNLALLIKQIMDIKSTRIDKYLKEIGETALCDLPERCAWTVEEFLSKTKSHCENCAQEMDAMSCRVEDAVNNLVQIFTERANIQVDTEVIEVVTEGSNSANLASESSEQPLGNQPTTIAADPTEEEQFKEECDELFNHFNHKCLEAILRATKLSLDLVRKRVFMSPQMGRRTTGYGGGGDDHSSGKDDTRMPFFRANITLVIPSIVMQPSLEEIQQALNKATQYILEVSRGIAQWGQERFFIPTVAVEEEAQQPNLTNKSHGQGTSEEMDAVPVLIPPQQLKNYFKSIADHKEVAKIVMMLSSATNSIRQDISGALHGYSNYHFLWEEDRDQTVKDFVATNPILSEFKSKILKFEKLDQKVEEMTPSIVVGSIELFADPLKLALGVEIKAWKLLFGRHLNLQYKQKMDEVVEFQDEYAKKLARPIKDLEDVRQAMAALEAIRQKQIEIDMSLGPIEEAYLMLQKFQVRVSKEETDRVDTFRYSFEKLQSQSGSVQTELVRIQPDFKTELLSAVQQFCIDVDEYESDYTANGPMVEGIHPQEASDRLNVFQSRFDELWRRYQTYSGGEELFGLTVTDYPCLTRIRKEFNLLQKLYGLYNAVMISINGYFDILWVEVDIEKINNELLDFQNRCRKLPKGLKDWQAFLELKKKIDDFNESCPLLELMANKAMKDRHWDRIAKTTGHTFDFDSDNFTLRNIMEAPLLENKEDIEDICISAVKEKDIEAKLKQVVAEWSNQTLSFSNFKARGELLLKGGEVAEIVSLLEDSLMVLGSLLSNRYNAPFKKDIQDWVQKLSNTSDIIENWLIVQNLWVYLEAVFVGGDIAKQLPQAWKSWNLLSVMEKVWKSEMDSKVQQLEKLGPMVEVDNLTDEKLRQLKNNEEKLIIIKKY